MMWVGDYNWHLWEKAGRDRFVEICVVVAFGNSTFPRDLLRQEKVTIEQERKKGNNK